MNLNHASKRRGAGTQHSTPRSVGVKAESQGSVLGWGTSQDSTQGPSVVTLWS